MFMDSALPEAETGQVIKELDRRHSVRSEREWIRHCPVTTAFLFFLIRNCELCTLR